MYARVDAWYGGSIVASDLPFTAGQVTVNPGRGVKRTLDLEIADVSLWDTLEPIGTELRAYRGIRYPDGTPEIVPLGIFGIDQDSMDVSPQGTISIKSAPDRWARIQRARLETPITSQSGSLQSAEILRLVTGAISGLTVLNTATSSATVKPLIWDRDRETPIIDMLVAIAADAYFDNTGQFVLRNWPLLSAPPVWTVDASASGVLLSGTRSRDRTRTYNVVIIQAASIDGLAPFAPVVAADNDMTSATYVGGPMGRVPYFWSSPLITSTGQAATVAATMLNTVKGQAAQMQLTSVVNPALDRGDVIWVTTLTGVVELHMIDALTIPLTPDGVQNVTTRSSRPDGDVPPTE